MLFSRFTRYVPLFSHACHSSNLLPIDWLGYPFRYRRPDRRHSGSRQDCCCRGKDPGLAADTSDRVSGDRLPAACRRDAGRDRAMIARGKPRWDTHVALRGRSWFFIYSHLLYPSVTPAHLPPRTRARRLAGASVDHRRRRMYQSHPPSLTDPHYRRSVIIGQHNSLFP